MSLELELEACRAAKDGVYNERNRLVALISSMYPSFLGKHNDVPGQDWSVEWKNVVYIETPEGQLAYHIHDSEVGLFSHLESDLSYVWDGHSTEEKYSRVERLIDMNTNSGRGVLPDVFAK